MRKQILGILMVLGALLISVTHADPSATLRVDPINFKISLDPQFELRDGVLTLTEHNTHPIGPNRSGVLWSARLGSQPQRFVLETTVSDVTLKDDGGHVLWVEIYTVPSLTLDFSQVDQAKLTDEAGQTLWTGAWNGKRTARSATPDRVECNGFVLLSPSGKAARLEDSQGQLLWTGPELKGEGLYIIDNGLRRPLSWHGNPFPANAKLPYDIAELSETVTVKDDKQTVIGAQPVSAIQITKWYGQGYYAAHPIVSQITPSVMPQPLIAGAYSVTFWDKDGALAQSQALTIDSIRTIALAHGRQLESANFHSVTRDAKGAVMGESSGATSSEFSAASGGT